MSGFKRVNKDKEQEKQMRITELLIRFKDIAEQNVFIKNNLELMHQKGKYKLSKIFHFAKIIVDNNMMKDDILAELGFIGTKEFPAYRRKTLNEDR